MYQLFYFPRNASWAPHIVFEEMGVKFELVLVDRKSAAQKSSEYLKLNPTGRIPTLIDGEQVIYESAAICLHLCDAHPSAGLVPDIGSKERAMFYQWLFYLTTSIQSELMLYFYPEKHTSLPEHAGSISAVHETRVTEMFALIDKELEGKEFLLGDRFSVCDIFLFMLSHWASDFAHPPLSFPHLGHHLRTLAQRPSIKKACATEGTSLEAYQ